MLPSEPTSPPGSATATAIFSESTSSPTCRISFFIGRLLSLVALRHRRAPAGVTPPPRPLAADPKGVSRRSPPHRLVGWCGDHLSGLQAEAGSGHAAFPPGRAA